MPHPWQTGPSIVDVLRGWDGTTPCDLPDEAADGDQIRFAAGAWDGILGHHCAGLDEQAEARLIDRLLAALRDLVQTDTDAARAHLYDLLVGESLVRHIDLFIRELTTQEGIGPAAVRRHARWLVRHAAHRNPLKFGIALLGLTGDESDLDVLRLLARHDEFTLFAAVAAAGHVADAVEEWWAMAQQVSGWGKIHLVERLCRHADDYPLVRAWLLRHGCANEVMPEYLALACAGSGDLVGALADDPVDDELLDGACVILTALLTPHGPAGDIDNYPDATSAIDSLLRHLDDRCATLRRLDAVRRIDDWLTGGEAETWAAREEAGWTAATRAELHARCQAILTRAEWPPRLRAAFAGADDFERYLAWNLARAVGVDLWPEAFAVLPQRPTDGWLYSCLLDGADAERAGQVFAFAEGHLDLPALASGPADVLGLGLGFEANLCVDALLQRMQQGDVVSEAIVAAALRSPVVRNRHLAAGVLEAVPASRWGESVIAALRQTAADEVNDGLKERWAALVTQLPTVE
ncbi:MAG: hypothetical protein U0736_01750 [Gemmataceae bacterium]